MVVVVVVDDGVKFLPATSGLDKQELSFLFVLLMLLILLFPEVSSPFLFVHLEEVLALDFLPSLTLRQLQPLVLHCDIFVQLQHLSRCKLPAGGDGILMSCCDFENK